MAEERRREIVDAVRAVLEKDGADAVTMRRVADELGIQAPSLYKHVAGKEVLHELVAADGMRELGAALGRARTIGGLAKAYRAWGLRHPHLYLLVTETALPSADDVRAAEREGRRRADELIPDPDRSRAFWAFCHGMTVLEIRDRFPAGAHLDIAWRVGVEAFENA